MGEGYRYRLYVCEVVSDEAMASSHGFLVPEYWDWTCYCSNQSLLTDQIPHHPPPLVAV